MLDTFLAIFHYIDIFIIFYYFYDIKNKKLPKTLIAIYAIAFLAVNLVTFKAWYDVLSLIAAMLFVLSVAQSEAKYYRILYFLNSVINFDTIKSCR